MKKSSDINDLIQSNARKLEQAPRPEAWKKLEQKLDSQRGRRAPRILRFRALSIAAAVTALMVVCYVAIWVVGTSAADRVDEAMASSFQLEELNMRADDPGEALKVVEFTRRAQDRLANPIVEGSPDKRVMVQAGLVNQSEISNSQKDTM